MDIFSNMKTIENKVSEYCKRNQLIEKNDKIILGVSGGADSVCLLFLLNKLKEVYQLSLYVVHVNHCIRDEAKEDANYVATLCEKLKIPYHIVSIDVHKMAKEQKLSIEEAGRDARYKAFTEAFLEINADKIADRKSVV